MSPRAGLDAVVESNISQLCSCLELNPGRPSRSLVTVLAELRHYLLFQFNNI
jgi:hypothetical protein